MPLARRGVLALAMLLSAGLAAAQSVAAAPPEVRSGLQDAQLQGSGRLRFLGLHVYDARLWVAGTTRVGSDWTRTPFALEVEYARSLDGLRIAERSLAEMRRQGDIEADKAQRWLDTMKKQLPDVKEGSRLTGLNLPGQGLRLFLDGRSLGEVADADFASRFFGIWLSPRTSEPALREALLGRGAP